MTILLRSKQLVTIVEDTGLQSQTDDNNLQSIWHTSNRFFKTTFVLCCSSILIFLVGLVGTTLNGKATVFATDTVLRKTSSLLFHNNDDRKLQQNEGKRVRPVEVGTFTSINNNPKIYSWYVERDHNIPKIDEDMQEQWKSAWTAAGYNPQILTIDDAKSHEDYDEFDKKVKAFFKRKMQLNSDDYTNCYFRYLAMSVKGGGIMVDLDTFPGADLALISSSGTLLVPEEFTIYCPTEASQSEQWLPTRQAGIACAVGSQQPDDWTHVAKLALWMTQMKASERQWTDFHSLLALHSGTPEEQAVKLVKNLEVNQGSSKPAWDTCVFRTV
mmetsp:Transcript_2871/g.4307  ORF Transcript_2871/g.4307 Transcript_2871/m.4307 type:complete len:328 (+) Transcript_2871:73-1056(+)